MPTAKSFKTTSDITRLVEQFEGGILPKAQWTHQAHVVVCLWYLLHHSPVDALRRLRQGILNYNESVGTPNTDASGYHETITRCYVMVILGFMIRQEADRPHVDYFGRLLEDPVSEPGYLFKFYSRERLLSVQARRAWVEPDLRDIV